jgi:putative transposase
MSEIIPLLICLQPILTRTSLRQLHHVVFAMLCNPSQATMLGLSRWTEKGGSYRTIQRLYRSPMDWLQVHWMVLKTHLIQSNRVYLLAGDEVVVNKAGKQTHGVGRFFSSIAQRPVASVSFMALSLIDVEARQSYPLSVEQIMPVEKSPEPETPAPKRQRGRPKGRKNHEKPKPTLKPLLCLFQGMLSKIEQYLASLQVKHIVLDGKFGNYPSTWVVREAGYHIISKMRHNSALYLPFDGAKPPRGPTSRYGHKLNYKALPARYLVSTQVVNHYRIDTYSLALYHKDYPDLLNVVVIVKTHLATNKRGHVVLFSTDLDLTAEQIVDYYSLRFQIEFNFRDAKQHWGLDDFMNTSQQTVTNAVNLAFLMVNLSQALLKPYREHHLDFSVRDLKAQFRARRYLAETIKMLPKTPEPDLISRIWQRLAQFGGIRTCPIDDFAA